MPKTQAENLLRELAGRTGGPVVELDADGLARLTLDGQPLSFFLAEEAETLAVLAALGELPDRPADRRRLAEDLLRANCKWTGTDGGAFGLDEDSGLVFLQKRWFLTPPPTPREFLTGLARLLHLARSWRERFEAAPAEPAAIPEYAFKV